MVFREVIFAATLLANYVVGQGSGSPECPLPWIPLQNKCYKFSSDGPLSWEDAKINCEKQGAELVSINSDSEDRFLQNWFSLNDNVPGKRNEWFTSGHTVPNTDRTNPTFRWLDESGFGSTVFWTNPETPQADTGDYVVYKYADTGNQQDQPGYFWVRAVGEMSRAYICEIFKTESVQIISEARGFVFGADNIHPDQIYRGPYFVSQPEDATFQISVDGVACTQDCPTVAFDCSAKGYPQPTYQWFEDTSTQTVPISAISVNYLTITNGRLTIHNPNRDRDTSTFWCEASNDFGKIRSEKATVKFITLDEFPKNSKDVPARAYDSAVIVCAHPKREGVKYSYEWFMNNDPNNWVNPVYNNHIFVSASGSLYFSSVTNSDDGAYHCTVSIEGGDESRNSAAYNLRVDSSPSYQDVAPIIHNDFIKIIPKNPQMGEKVYLECFARFTTDSGDSAEYKWERKDGLALPKGHEIVDYNRRLIIHDVKSEDEGEYICTVKYRQASNSKTISLSVSAKPYFGEGRLDNLHLDQGQDYKWACVARGNPVPTYEWYANSTLLSPDTLSPEMRDRISFSPNKNTLEFGSLNKDVDPGMYQCAATNAHGTTYSSAQLRVLEFKPNFDKHPMLGRILATEDGNATLPCRPEGAPKPTIRWLKNGAPYNLNRDSSSPKRLLPNNDLYLSGIQKNVDEAVYTCVAENKALNPETGEYLSEARATISLVVVHRTTLNFGPKDEDVLLGSEVILECRANFDTILDLVYLWYHNDRWIDFDDWKMSQIYRRGEGVNRGDLHVKNITYEERGYYKCTVMTKSDYATLSARVVVYGPPGEPAGIKASNAGKHTVVISWSKGSANGAQITSYIIEKFNTETKEWVLAKEVTAAADVSSSNTTVDGLFADTGYMFRVKAVNQHGTGVAGLVSNPIQTTPDKPTTYPDNIRAGGGKEGTLVIKWDPLPREKWNAPNIEYIVQYKEYDEDSSKGSWSGCNKDQPIVHGTKKTGKCTATIGGEKYYLRYYVRVWVRNEMGNGPIPDPVVGISAVRVPTQTPQQIVVQPLNATALTVYWDPVPNLKTVTGGELSGFHIQYWKDGTKQEYGRRNTILGNVTDGTIIGLEPATDYMVTAQLFNSAGDAPPGRTIPQTTWYNAPLNMPEYVTINRTDDQTVGVHFRGVTTGPNEEPLDGYKVRIWRQGESVRNANDFDCGRRTWIMIDHNFEKDVFYNLRVFGYSRGGVGKMSSPLIIFTIGCNKRQTTDDAETVWEYLCSSSNHLSVPYVTLSSILILYHFVIQLL